MASLFELFLLLTLLGHFAYVIPESKENPISISTRLIHRDSINSPCFNSSSCSILDFIYHPLKKIKSYNEEGSHIKAGVRPGDRIYLFFVEFYVGNQSTPQYGVMDTGSDLLWIQCAPCAKCPVTRSPIYDPRMSTSYKHLPCDTQICNLANGMCDTNDKCVYGIQYGGGEDHTSGYLATEIVSFQTDDEGLTRISNVVLGCSHDNSNGGDTIMTGVFGLGYSKLSLAFKFNKFSYCIGRIGDPNYEYNRLVLGDGAILEGDSTNLIFHRWFYYLNLEGISLGGSMLDIPSRTFAFRKRSPSGPPDGVLIDSGKSITSLVKDAYQVVSDKVKEMMLLQKRVADWGDRLCFLGDVSRDTIGFPTLIFHFAGGAELALEADSLFKQEDERWFCMAIQRSTKSYSIIGLNAQEYYNVGYHITRKKIYFQKMDCRALEG